MRISCRDSDVLAFPSITVCPMPMEDLLSDSGLNLTRHLEESALSIGDTVQRLQHHYVEDGNGQVISKFQQLLSD